MTLLPQKPKDWYWVYHHKCGNRNNSAVLYVIPIDAWIKTSSGRIVGIFSQGEASSTLNGNFIEAPSILGSQYKHFRDLTQSEKQNIGSHQPINVCSCILNFE